MNIRRNKKLERARQELVRVKAEPDGTVRASGTDLERVAGLKPYRSRAERTAVIQRNIQIGLSVVILLVGVANLLIQTL